MAISLGGFSGGGGGGAVDSVNGQTGVVVVSGDDIAADHSASNYTAANANIDGHLSGIDTKLGTLVAGLTYQGSYDATNNLPSLANTLKGDFYLVSSGGTRFGRDWAVGDHLVINEDMGGTVSNGKIDKIDNIHAIEQSLFSYELGVAGSVDCIAEHDGELAVIDFKTAKKPKPREWVDHHFVQCAAYACMLYEMTGIMVKKFVIIMSCENGEITIYEEYDKKKYIQLLSKYIREFVEFKLQEYDKS